MKLTRKELRKIILAESQRHMTEQSVERVLTDEQIDQVAERILTAAGLGRLAGTSAYEVGKAQLVDTLKDDTALANAAMDAVKDVTSTAGAAGRSVIKKIQSLFGTA